MQFISTIKDNNIQQANKVFELEIQNQSDRSQCINDSIENLYNSLTTVSKKEQSTENDSFYNEVAKMITERIKPRQIIPKDVVKKEKNIIQMTYLRIKTIQ